MKKTYTNINPRGSNLIRFAAILILVVLTKIGFSADYYWVAGSGDWSDHAHHWATTSGGAVFHPSVPSQFDNVIFDVNSFSAAGQTVTVSYEGFCKKFDARDIISGVNFTSTKNLNIYDGMEIDQNFNYAQTGNLNIFAGGLLLGTTTPGTPLSFTVNGTITIESGGITTGRNVTFNNPWSYITLVKGGNVLLGNKNTTTMSQLSINTGKLTVGDSSTFTGYRVYVYGGAVTVGNRTNYTNYYTLYISTSNLVIGDYSNFKTYYETTQVFVGDLVVGENSTFYDYSDCYIRNGNVRIGKNSSFQKDGYTDQIWGGSFILGENATFKNSGNIYVYNGTFQWDNTNNIKNYNYLYVSTGSFTIAAGSAFNPAGNLYTGNGSLTIKTGASTTVSRFESANGSLTVEAGATATINGDVILTNGTITLDPAATLSWWANLYLRATQFGQYDIRTGGRDIKRIQFDGSHYNAEYTFQDNLKASNDGVFLYANKVNFNGKGVDVYHFYSWTGGEVWTNLTGTDTVYVRSQFRMYPSSNTHLNMGSAVIKWYGTDAHYLFGGYNTTYNDLFFKAEHTGGQQISFEGNNCTVRDIKIDAYGSENLSFNNNFTVRDFTLKYKNNYTANPSVNFSGNWNITGSFYAESPTNMRLNLNSYANNTFNSFQVTNLNQWMLRGGTTQTFSTLSNITGSCDKTITIKGETLGSQGTLSMASGSFTGDWLIMQDVKGTGGATFTANNTVDLGNVTGWTINSIAPRDFYWVGHNGNWNVPANWSLTSGGAPGSCGVPNRTDNAIFDANSFSASGQFVNINTTAEVKNMIWNNVVTGSGINGGNDMNIFGSLQLASNMVFNHNGTFYFQSVALGNTIKSNGIKMRQVIFRGQNQTTGEWNLLDDFNAHDNYVYFERGTLRTNGHNMDVHSLYNWTGAVARLYLSQTDTSSVKVQYEFRIYPTSNVKVYADSTNIIFDNNNNHMYFYSGDYTAKYRDIIFNSRANAGYYIHMQYPSTSRDIKINCWSNQYMYLYDQKTARDVSINYTNASPYGQWIQMNGNNTFRSLKVKGIGNNRPTVYLHGTNTIGRLDVTNLSGLYFGGWQYLTSAAPVSGTCDRLIQFWGGTGVNMASGLFEVNWATMSNLTATGGATFNANNILGTYSGLTGWNVSNIPQTNFYWVGGTGNWTDPSHWSYTSGGTPGVCPLPSRFDNVFFDVNSFTAPNQIVYANTTIQVKNMVWNNVNYPRFYGGNQVEIYGSLQLDPKLSQEESGWWYFRSKTVGNTINAAGKKFWYVRFDGEGYNTGEWKLQSDLNVWYDLYIDRGTFISDSNNISARMFYCWTGSPTKVDLTGTQTVTVTNQFRIYPNSFTLIMDKADVKFTGGDQFYFIGGNNRFNNIEMNATSNGGTYIEFNYNNIVKNVKITASGYQTIRFYGNSTYNDVDIQFNNPSTNIPNVYFHGSNTINDLSITSIGNSGPYIYLYSNNIFNNLVSAGLGTRLYPAGNTTQRVNDVLALGSGGFPVFFQSQTQGTQATIYKPTGTVCLDYVWMRDIKAASDLNPNGTMKTAFFAGNNSVNMGNNSNWTFSSCDGFYWVGGSGKWSETNHWATASGGTQLHASTPTQFDNVFFDANSFTTSGEIVNIDVADPRCKNMSWSSSLFTPTVIGSTDLNIYGSLKFVSNMNVNFTGTFNFKSDITGNEINSGGHTLANVNFTGGNDGEGAWTLANDLVVSNSVNLNNGSFNTNGKELTTKNFNSTTINTRKLTLGTSKVTISDGQWNPSGTTNFTFEKGTSTIVMTGTAASNFYGQGLVYNNVTFTTPGQLTSALTGANTFNILRFDAGVTAALNPVIQLATQIKALGTCARNVTLLSSIPGSAATLKQTSGTVDGKFLTLKDNTATGGATFKANLSNDQGNVTGWSFTSAPVITLVKETGLVDCVLNNDGWAKVTVTEGTPPFSYLWSTSETTDSIGGLIPGMYSVTVTDSAGCSITESVEVLNRPSVLDPIGFTMSDDKICLGTSIQYEGGDVVSNALSFDGSNDFVEVGNFASLSPTASQPVTFEAWIKPASTTGGTLAGKFSNGQTTASNFVIALESGKIKVSGDGTDVLLSNASISTTAWTHLAVILKAGSGNSIIYLNGAYDNSGTLTYNTVNGNTSFTLGTIADGAVASDYYNGSLDEVRVWNTVRTLSDINQNMTVPQAGTQAGLSAYYRLDDGTGSSIAFDRTPAIHNGTLTNADPSSAWISPGAFTPVVTYKWDFGDFTTSTGKSVNHTYTSSGTYIVSLSTKDATGCPNIVKDTVVVSKVITTVISENVKCYGANNGTISVSASGGVAPYQYSINGGTTFYPSGSFTNLSPGTYTVFVKDAIACGSTMQNVVITQPSSLLQFSAAVVNVVCPADLNGKITVNATGGTAPYQYSKNAGISYQASNVFADLTAGNYTIRVRDYNNCSPDDQVITVQSIDNIPPVIVCPANITINATNMMGCDVVVNFATPVASDNCTLVTVAQTAGPVSGSLFPIGTTTVTFTATDGANNTTSCSFNITVADNTPPVALCKNDTVYLDALGSASISASDLNDGSYDNCGNVQLSVSQSVFTCANLGSNQVTLTVTDGVGNISTCTSTVLVIDNLTPTMLCLSETQNRVANSMGCEYHVVGNEFTPSSVTDNCSAGLILTYTLAGATTGTGSDLSGVGLGFGTTTITWTLTDGSNNSTFCSFDVTVVNDVVPVIDGPAVVCAGSSSAQYSTASGMTNYTWLVSPGGIILSGGASADAFVVVNWVTPGAQTVSVNYTNTFGCTANMPTVLDLWVSLITVTWNNNLNIQCPNSNLYVLTGGQPEGGTYSGTGVTGNNFDATIAGLGTHTLTYTFVDVNGCTNSATNTITVEDVTPPVMTCVAGQQDRNPNSAACTYTETEGEFTPSGVEDNCSGELTLTYSLSGATTGTGSNLSGVQFNLGITTVSWTLTDVSLNQSFCTFTVSVVNNLSTTILSPTFAGGFNIKCNGGNTGSVDLTVAGGTAPYAFVWSNGATTEDLSGIPAGTYSVTVTDANGCTTETSIVLTEPTPVSADAGFDQPVCYSFQTTIGGSPSAVGGVGPYTYSWSPINGLNDPSIANPTAGPLSTTTYTVTVTDQNGCIAMDLVVITVNPLPVASIVASTPDDFCNGVTLTAHSSTTENLYQWSRGDDTQSIFLSISNDPAGLYTVFVTDLNGCTSANPASYTYNPENLTSSYTILGFKEVQLGESNTVVSGSVGVTGNNRTAHIKKGAKVNSPGSFVKADNINAHPTAIILKKIYDRVITTLPAMLYNTQAKVSGKIKVKKNTVTTISTERVSIEIEENCTVTITGSVYGEISIGKGSTVIFTGSVLYLEKLKTEDNKLSTQGKVQFAQDAQVRVKEKVDIGKYTAVNPYNASVIFYIGTIGHGEIGQDDDSENDNGELKVKAEGTSFTASAYVPRGKIHVEENAAVTNTGTMTGQFIANKVISNGKYITWNWHSCGASLLAGPSTTPETGTGKEAKNESVFNVYPVPNNGSFTVSINSPVEDHYTISVYNNLGFLLFEKKDIMVNGLTEEAVDLQNVSTGIYYVIFRNDAQQVVKKVVINK